MQPIAQQLARMIAAPRGGFDNAGDPDSYRAARSYRYWRLKGSSASAALAMARREAAEMRARYPDSLIGAASWQNAPDDRGGRWIENPAAAGLRFVGFADEIAGRSVDHKGWFQEDDGCSGHVVRGAVYQLPARDGRPVYVEAVRMGSEGKRGWDDQCGVDGAALIFIGERHRGEPGGYQFDAGDDPAARDAARGADREAEILAERERDYQRAANAGIEATELIEAADSSWDVARRLMRELREVRRTISGASYPELCSAMRGSIRARLETWRDNRRKAARLIEEFSGRDGFAENFAPTASC